MASKVTEDEVSEIFKLIDDKKNFVLNGGAGSGKTYSLVSIINEIYSQNPLSKIACITYTNAAVHEIENRVANKKLKIATIHDFFWENIYSYQKELKETLVEGINKQIFKNIKVETPYDNNFQDGIKYTEHLRIDYGEISHDEIIILANQMFEKYPKLCSILNNKYDFIFVDEYQDTFSEVVKILLDFLPRGDNVNKCIIGFFGDSMQAIYNNGIGDLNEYIKLKKVTEIVKKQNRRNPQTVIDLANKIRTDNLKQEPSEDFNAPNMENGIVKQGSIKFLYGDNISYDNLKKASCFVGWDFNDSKETKELRLTHNLIADTAGFPSLMEIYDKDPLIKLKNEFCKHIKENNISIDEDKSFGDVVNEVEWTFSDKVKVVENRGKSKFEVFIKEPENKKLYDLVKNMKFIDVKKIYFDKDNLISDKKAIDETSSTQSKRDKLIRHLFKIQSLVKMYKEKKYNDFLRRTSFRITSIKDKEKIHDKISELSSMENKTIGDVISYADKSDLCILDDTINDFIKSNQYLYSRVSEVKYIEFISLYNYLEGFSPLSTQHKIKGEEFKNVLIILDNGKWNSYNFKYLLDPQNKNCKQDVLLRTQKLFYVCCTRAMDNLVVYCDKPTDAMLKTAKSWFGEDNCQEIYNVI